MQHSIVDALKAGLSLAGSHAVFDQMPCPILIKDQDLRFRAINKQFAVMLPKKRKDILGLTVRDLYPEMADVFEARERAVLETGIEQSFYETLENEDGVARDYVTKVTRIDGGAAGMFVCISLNDVTDLNHARLRALAADRLKSEFLANMSHEIRTPLNGVLGMTELLLHSDLTDRQKALAEIVSSSGVQLLRVLDDVLDFSHIEAGQITLTPADFDLEEAIDDVVTLLASKAAEKGVELITHIRPTAPRRLRLDAARLRQILTNLIGNAIKFTDQGRVLVEVGAEDDRLTIVVEDTGLGIPPEQREQIFKKFVRSKLQDGKVRGGAGLGLTISASLVRLMGGEIGVDGAKGGGARFWLRLPVSRSEPAAPSGGEVVGVIDRNDLRADAIADRLIRWGFTPKRLASSQATSAPSAVVIGPDDSNDAARPLPDGAAVIQLTPLATDIADEQSDPRRRRTSHPMRGSEVEALLNELVQR